MGAGKPVKERKRNLKKPEVLNETKDGAPLNLREKTQHSSKHHLDEETDEDKTKQGGNEKQISQATFDRQCLL